MRGVYVSFLVSLDYSITFLDIELDALEAETHHHNFRRYTMAAKLTRGSERSIAPKLKSWEEKEKAREEMEVLLEEYLANNGVIHEYPQGATALQYGRTKKQQDELVNKGKAGANATHKQVTTDKPTPKRAQPQWPLDRMGVPAQGEYSTRRRKVIL
mgnify:CR=1|tara:strand:+ start:210 stop:680 length:471 start_codon:yes stop_codon:yes gene_type:complete